MNADISSKCWDMAISQMLTKSFYGRPIVTRSEESLIYKDLIKLWYTNNPSACLTAKQLNQLHKASKSHTDRAIKDLLHDKFLILGDPGGRTEKYGPRPSTYELREKPLNE